MEGRRRTPGSRARARAGLLAVGTLAALALLAGPVQAQQSSPAPSGQSDLLGDVLDFLDLDPGPPPPAPPPPAPPSSAPPATADPEPGDEPAPGPKRGRQELGKGTVGQVLARARRRGSISAAEHRRMRATMRSAKGTRARLGGRRRQELSQVIVTVERLARSGRLTVARLDVLFLGLRRNTSYWRRNGPPRSGARRSFGSSPIIFQYFPGQGWQFHPLANFGRVNALYNVCVGVFGRDKPCRRGALRRHLDELADLASVRSGFQAWEYFFAFGGGAPPWTSGMSQGAAVQAYARAASLLEEPGYERIARAALGAFTRGPSAGVRVPSSRGRHFLLYSFAPGLRVLNGHLQAVIGLFDMARVSDDRRARALFRAGDRSARRELRRYDTGSWSRYALGGARATRGYHELVTVFLERLCERTRHSTYCRYGKRFRGYLGR